MNPFLVSFIKANCFYLYFKSELKGWWKRGGGWNYIFPNSTEVVKAVLPSASVSQWCSCAGSPGSASHVMF